MKTNSELKTKAFYDKNTKRQKTMLYPINNIPDHTLSHYQKCRKLAPSKNTNEYSLFKSNVYEKFKLQKRFSRSTR